MGNGGESSLEGILGKCPFCEGRRGHSPGCSYLGLQSGIGLPTHSSGPDKKEPTGDLGYSSNLSSELINPSGYTPIEDSRICSSCGATGGKHLSWCRST